MSTIPKVQHDADAFVAGNTAMLFREAWVIGQIQKNNPTLDYGVAQIPAWTAGGPFKTLLQHDGINVSGKSRNQQAAWDFVKFLTNPQSALHADRAQRLGVGAAGRGLVAAAAEDPAIRGVPEAAGEPAILSRAGARALGRDREPPRRPAARAPISIRALKDNPTKQAALIHRWAQQTDQLLKEADLYGTT